MNCGLRIHFLTAGRKLFGSLVHLFIPFLLLSLPCLHSLCLQSTLLLSLLSFPAHMCCDYPASPFHRPACTAHSSLLLPQKPLQSVPPGAMRTSIPVPSAFGSCLWEIQRAYKNTEAGRGLPQQSHQHPTIASPTSFWSSAPDLVWGCHPGLPPFKPGLMGPPTHKTVNLVTRLAEGNPKKLMDAFPVDMLEKVVLECQIKCVRNQAQRNKVWTWAHTLSETEDKILCWRGLQHTPLSCWLEANSAPRDSGGSVPVFLSWSLFPPLCLVFASFLVGAHIFHDQ